MEFESSVIITKTWVRYSGIFMSFKHGKILLQSPCFKERRYKIEFTGGVCHVGNGNFISIECNFNINIVYCSNCKDDFSVYCCIYRMSVCIERKAEG